MKFTSYWLDTAPKGPRSGRQTTVDGHTDVAVIGGGLTGVVAALHLARRGAKVTLRAAHRGRLRPQRRHGHHRGTGQNNATGSRGLPQKLLTVDHDTRMVDNRPAEQAARDHQEESWDSMSCRGS